jgi:ribosomal protein S18 acetylase RimI-like enzyme
MTEDLAAAPVPTPRAPLDDLERTLPAFDAAWAAMVQACRDGRYDESAGVVRYRMMAPVPAFNGVWCRDADPGAREVLTAVDEFVGGELPWNVQLRPGYPTELDDAFAARGLVVAEDIPFMVLPDISPDISAVAPPAALTFRQAVTFNDADAALALVEQGFGMSPELTRQMMPLRMLFMDGATTWIATEDRVDVATALAVVVDDVCGIFNVATPAEHRGRGHGGAVTAQALNAAAAMGARSAYLQSSPMGFSVYERLGFQSRELWRQWMPREYVDSA